MPEESRNVIIKFIEQPAVSLICKFLNCVKSKLYVTWTHYSLHRWKTAKQQHNPKVTIVLYITTACCCSSCSSNCHIFIFYFYIFILIKMHHAIIIWTCILIEARKMHAKVWRNSSSWGFFVRNVMEELVFVLPGGFFLSFFCKISTFSHVWFIK